MSKFRNKPRKEISHQFKTDQGQAQQDKSASQIPPSHDECHKSFQSTGEKKDNKKQKKKCTLVNGLNKTR